MSERSRRRAWEEGAERGEDERSLRIWTGASKRVGFAPSSAVPDPPRESKPRLFRHAGFIFPTTEPENTPTGSRGALSHPRSPIPGIKARAKIIGRG
jgi:hypothetical protein